MRPSAVARRVLHLRLVHRLPSTLALALALAAGPGALLGCADLPGAAADDPNAGLLRDFVDGKFDDAGHPLNAKVIPAPVECGDSDDAGAVALDGTCELAVPAGATTGRLTLNARVRVRQHASAGAIVTVTALDAGGATLATETLTVARLRALDHWLDLPIHVESGAVAQLRITPAAGAHVDLDYVEVFPRRLGVVISPGSGVTAAADPITFEVPAGQRLEKLTADGVDLLPTLERLLDDGRATRTTTAFRTLYTTTVGDLLPGRADVTELRVHASGDSSRVQLRATPAPCVFEGDPAGARVLVTGFQPFPADGWHENVSAVAVGALDPASLTGARVMRLVLPVEYDRAAAMITEVITRCAPAHVISFGQGGGAIALEETAYNLQDTGELAGGAPDNRGIIRAATPIAADGPATRATRLPLGAIEEALGALGEAPERSDDPGRYICNNVMYRDVEAIAATGGRAGFIHLPYTTAFDDDARARWGRVAAAAVQATVDAPE